MAFVTFADARIEDAGVVTQVCDELFDLVDQGHDKIVLDLHGVTVLSSLALPRFLGLRNRLVEMGQTLPVIGADSDLRHALRISGFDGVVNVCDTEMQALDLFLTI